MHCYEVLLYEVDAKLVFILLEVAMFIIIYIFAFLVTSTLLLSLVYFKNNCTEFQPSKVA